MRHSGQGHGRRAARAPRVRPPPSPGAPSDSPTSAAAPPWAPPAVTWPPLTARYLRALFTEAIPILQHGVQRAAWDGQPFALPYISLDTTRRPDIYDLSRVHEHEGPGGLVDSRWLWHGRGDWVILERQCIVPVHARVVLRFEQELHGEFIERAARLGLFGVRIGDGILIWETLAGDGELKAFLDRRASGSPPPLTGS